MHRDPWADRLRPGHPRREQTVASLHDLLLRVARHELARRGYAARGDLAAQAADAALATVLAQLGEFPGRTRFTTWAFKYVIRELSGRLTPSQARAGATAEAPL